MCFQGRARRNCYSRGGDALEFMTGKAVTGIHDYFQNGQPIAIIMSSTSFRFYRLELLPNPSGRGVATEVEVFLRMREHISWLASSASPHGGADATLC